MKTKLLLVLALFTSVVFIGTAQVPQGFNYQAIARDGSGNPIPGAALQVKLTVQSTQTG